MGYPSLTIEFGCLFSIEGCGSFSGPNESLGCDENCDERHQGRRGAKEPQTRDGLGQKP